MASGCGIKCFGECSAQCGGTCRGGCEGSEQNSAIPEGRGCGLCSSNCSISCSTEENEITERIEDLSNSFNCDTCQSSCVAQCAQCEGTCKDGCYASCSYLCNAGCEDESKTIPQLKRVMDANNIKEIFNFLVHEAEVRRNLKEETEFEDTIRMIALTAQIGQTFIDETSAWNSIWDIDEWMISNEEMQRLSSSRQQKINRNQVLYSALATDSIISSQQLMKLLILAPYNTESENYLKSNKTKQALLNDVLFNKTSLTLQAYEQAINGTYESILEREGFLYQIDFSTAKTEEIYSILMMLYIAYNGQSGLKDRIFQILKSERIRICGNNSNLISNNQIIKLLTINKNENDIIKKNKQILISELLYYHFAPELMILGENIKKTIRSLGNTYITITDASNGEEIIKTYHLPNNKLDSDIRKRLNHYYYYVSGDKIIKIYYPKGTISTPRSESIQHHLNYYNNLKPNSIESQNYKTLIDYLSIDNFKNDIDKYDFIEPYENNSQRKEPKQNLKEIKLSNILIDNISNSDFLLTYELSGNLNLVDSESSESSPYFITLEFNEGITDLAQSNLSIELKNRIKSLQEIAYRFALYHFQYGGFHAAHKYYDDITKIPKVDNITQKYPYYDALKKLYDTEIQNILNLSSTLATDAQKNMINYYCFSSADELEAYLDILRLEEFYNVLMSGTDQILYRSANFTQFDSYHNVYMGSMSWENIHLAEEQRDYNKNPAHKYNEDSDTYEKGGRSGFPYEIYSSLMAALVKERGQVVMYAQQTEEQINPFRNLFQLIANERMKVLGEGPYYQHEAYDSNLKYSKLLNHYLELPENLKTYINWNGYYFDLKPPFSITETCGDPDWRHLDFNLYGSYPASTEIVINSLNFDFLYNDKYYSHKTIQEKDLLCYNKNVFFTDMHTTNFGKFYLFASVPIYGASTQNIKNLLTIKNFDYRNNFEIDGQNFREQFEQDVKNIQNPIYKEIVSIFYNAREQGTDNRFERQIYFIYDKNDNGEFEWQEYSRKNNEENIFNNTLTTRLLQKSRYKILNFSQIGRIGFMHKILTTIPESYKEVINSLENYSKNSNYIIKNEVPMIIEDILVNVFEKDLGTNYQSGTLTINNQSYLITKLLGKDYYGNKEVSVANYNTLKDAGVNMEQYFKSKNTDSKGQIITYIMKDNIKTNNLDLNSQEEVFKHFYNTYHKNAYQINKTSINDKSEFEPNEIRNNYSKIFSFANPSEEGSYQWLKIAQELRDEMVEVNETSAGSFTP